MPGNVCASCKSVVEQQTELHRDTAARAVVVDRDEDLQRPDQLRDAFEQPGPLVQRLAHETEAEMLEVAQPAVDHLRRRRRRLRAADSFLEQHDLISPPRQLPRHPRAIDPASDDRDARAHGEMVPQGRRQMADGGWRKILRLLPSAIRHPPSAILHFGKPFAMTSAV